MGARFSQNLSKNLSIGFQKEFSKYDVKLQNLNEFGKASVIFIISV
jgi:hypothetical protein